jgi:hypothetical protein
LWEERERVIVEKLKSQGYEPHDRIELAAVATGVCVFSGRVGTFERGEERERRELNLRAGHEGCAINCSSGRF